MRGFVILLRRELVRRRPAHLAALALGLFVLVTPWLRGSSASAAETRGAAAIGVAALWALGMALVDGLGYLANDLRERRLAFDFRLPVAASAIWAARTLAALSSIGLGVALVLAPSAIAGADLAGGLAGFVDFVLRPSGFRFAAPALSLALLPLVAFFALDFVGLAIASRSRWVALDFTAAILFKSLAVAAILPLWRAGADEAAGRGILLAVAGGLAALLVATWRQIALGRTETDRAHRGFSLGFATVALAIVGPLFAWSHWYRTPSFGALERQSIQAVPLSADLVWVSGSAGRKDLLHSFIVEPRSNRSVALDGWRDGVAKGRARASADGHVVAWTTLQRTGVRTWSTSLRYASPEALLAGRFQEGLVWDGIPFTWALSPGGDRVVSVWRNVGGETRARLVVDELRSDATLQVLQFDDRCSEHGPLLFLSEYSLRASCPGRRWSPIFTSALDIDLGTGDASMVSRPLRRAYPLDDLEAHAPGLRFEPPAIRTAETRESAGILVREDSRDTFPLALPPQVDASATPSSARFLVDHRLGLVFNTRRSAILALYSETGLLERDIALPSHWCELLAQIDDGRDAVVGCYDPIASRGAYNAPEDAWMWLFRIPLDGRPAVEIARSLQPLRPDSSMVPTNLFLDFAKRVLWLDLTNGTLVTLGR